VTCVLRNVLDYDDVVEMILSDLSSLIDFLEHVNRQLVHLTLHEVQEILELN
jgi:hypothetical protein